MHLAYVRRSRELERLRELASRPLSEWIVTPAGLSASDPEPVTADDHNPSDETPVQALTPPPSEPEPQVVASLPPKPADTTEMSATRPVPIASEPADQSVTAAPVAVEAALQATTDVLVEPDLSRVVGRR